MTAKPAVSRFPTLGPVYDMVRELYVQWGADLPFHGWHHISFVFEHAVDAAVHSGCDPDLVGIAALLHDLNYAVSSGLDAQEGAQARAQVLKSLNLAHLTERIEGIVTEAQTRTRSVEISAEAKALSDADSLYKCLPITPVMLAPRFLAENGMGLKSLARKIVDEQLPLLTAGLYFYSSEYERRYGDWARLNLELWVAILECLDDPMVQSLVQDAEL